MSVGERLAAARLERGKSVADVAAATRLRPSVVSAIEAGAWSELDDLVFVKAHVKSYAQFVGEDVESILAELTAEVGAEAATRPQPDRAVTNLDLLTKGALEPLPERKTHTLKLVVASLAALVALLAWVKLGAGAQTIDNLLPDPSPSDSVSGSPSASTPSDAPTIVDPSVVTVTVVATGDCWLTATAGTGETLYQETLHAGTTLTFVDPTQINLRIGNAGALQLTVNGVELGYLGADGQVLDHVFTVGNPTASE